VRRRNRTVKLKLCDPKTGSSGAFDGLPLSQQMLA
jgi:hypothetical protein